MNAESRTRHLIDPELLPGLDLLPPFEFTAASLPFIREGLTTQADALPPPPLMPVEKMIEGPAGPLLVLWFDPAPGTRDRPVVLHMHGGGMVLGAVQRMMHGPAALALQLGVPVASVDYRLAPETPFPGPQEDCYSALEWLANNASALGIDASRIGVAGESAGGGLAAAVAQMARDKGGPKVAAQILTYPMLDHRVGSEIDPWCNAHTGEFIWTRDSNQFGWRSLQGDYLADDARKGWFSPSLAADLRGLPPAWIGVGMLDLFLDEDLDYGRRLIDAGVPVELQVYPGAYHGFTMLANASVVQNFTRDMLAAMRRMLKIQ